MLKNITSHRIPANKNYYLDNKIERIINDLTIVFDSKDGGFVFDNNNSCVGCRFTFIDSTLNILHTNILVMPNESLFVNISNGRFQASRKIGCKYFTILPVFHHSEPDDHPINIQLTDINGIVNDLLGKTSYSDSTTHDGVQW